MTPRQRILLRQTFEELVPLPKRFGLRFYEKLFELDPELRRLFRGDAERQASMLAEALTLAVLNLINEGIVSAEIRRLGARHRTYGVVDDHYVTFGAALVAVLEERLDKAFTLDVRTAWHEAWIELAVAMQAAESPAPTG